MGTLTGMVIAAFRRASPTPLPQAYPAAVPGWYALYLGYRAVPLIVAETANLQGCVQRLRYELSEASVCAGESIPVDHLTVMIRWVEAEPFLGPAAASPDHRRAIENVLISILGSERIVDQFTPTPESTS